MEVIHRSTPPAAESVRPILGLGASRSEVSNRLVSLDVFRGVTMLFMASEIMRIPAVAGKFTESRAAQWIAYTLDHVPWTGVVPSDLIQPSFVFMVGVADPTRRASARRVVERVNRRSR